MFSRSDRAEEDIAGNARSPSKEAPSERVKKVQINNHRYMFVAELNAQHRGCEKRTVVGHVQVAVANSRSAYCNSAVR